MRNTQVCTGQDHPPPQDHTLRHTLASFHIPKRKRGLIGAALGLALSHGRDPASQKQPCSALERGPCLGKRRQPRENWGQESSVCGEGQTCPFQPLAPLPIHFPNPKGTRKREVQADSRVSDETRCWVVVF